MCGLRARDLYIGNCRNAVLLPLRQNAVRMMTGHIVFQVSYDRPDALSVVGHEMFLADGLLKRCLPLYRTDDCCLG